MQTDAGRQEKVKLIMSFLTDRPGLKMGKRVLVPAKNFPGYLAVPILLPFALVAVGGLVGGALGGAGVGVNVALAKSSLPIAGKVSLMVLVAALAAVIWFFVIAALFAAIA